MSKPPRVQAVARIMRAALLFWGRRLPGPTWGEDFGQTPLSRTVVLALGGLLPSPGQ